MENIIVQINFLMNELLEYSKIATNLEKQEYFNEQITFIEEESINLINTLKIQDSNNVHIDLLMRCQKDAFDKLHFIRHLSFTDAEENYIKYQIKETTQLFSFLNDNYKTFKTLLNTNSKNLFVLLDYYKNAIISFNEDF